MDAATEASRVRANAEALSWSFAPTDADLRDRIARALADAYWAGRQEGARHFEPVNWPPAPARG
jgi:hypothetical protein